MQKQKVELVREPSTKYGTFGTITMPDGTKFYSLELPDHDNARRISCIPKGVYSCELVYSSRFKQNLYEVKNVKNRGNILFHSGNWAGDKSDPSLRSDVDGCILVGLGKSDNLGGQKAITSSRKALASFMSILNKEPFELEIK